MPDRQVECDVGGLVEHEIMDCLALFGRVLIDVKVKFGTGPEVVLEQ